MDLLSLRISKLNKLVVLAQIARALEIEIEG